MVHDAQATRSTLRIIGGGSWLNAGRPVHAQHAISTRALRDVIEYVPGDLVITVGAGITFDELEAVTAQHGQWLALDPFVAPDASAHATIGAAVATASHGPLSLGFGRVRDLVLGLSFVTGTGASVRVGGRVVKNVAGFDLVRLSTGAWGTLGIITDVSLRLHARPAVDETFAIVIDMPRTPAAFDEALDGIVRAMNNPPLVAATSSLAALALLPPGLFPHHTSVPDAPSDALIVLARAVGNRARVSALRHMLAELGAHVSVDTSVWAAVRRSCTGNTNFRVAGPRQALAARLREISQWLAHTGADDATVIIDPMRGGMRVSCQLRDFAAGASPESTMAFPASSLALPESTMALPEGVIAEQLPPSRWSAYPAVANGDVSRQLRERFDPAGVFNPGILGDASSSAGGDRT